MRESGSGSELSEMMINVAVNQHAPIPGCEFAERRMFRPIGLLSVGNEVLQRIFELRDFAIPFAGRSRMEVDFYCEAARLVIELDGAQHLADADAYRRDRERDALLQEQGYFVLRFLAEDLAVNLDKVLDAVLRVLENRLSQRRTR